MHRLIAVLVIILLPLTFLTSNSAGEVGNRVGGKQQEGAWCDRRGGVIVGDNEKVLGSRPPSCVNKCIKCRPCKPTLVIPPHHHQKNNNNNNNNANANANAAAADHYRSSLGDPKGEDDTYYLLSWRCVCGHQLFHP